MLISSVLAHVTRRLLVRMTAIVTVKTVIVSRKHHESTTPQMRSIRCLPNLHQYADVECTQPEAVSFLIKTTPSLGQVTEVIECHPCSTRFMVRLIIRLFTPIVLVIVEMTTTIMQIESQKIIMIKNLSVMQNIEQYKVNKQLLILILIISSSTHNNSVKKANNNYNNTVTKAAIVTLQYEGLRCHC